MTPQQPAADALKLVLGLVGERIARVVYREIKYEDGEPGYRARDRHSLDYGPELHLVSGRVISFIWKWPVSYYLGAIEGNLSTELEGDHAIWDASGEPEWIPVIDREISSSCLEWFQDEEAEGDFPLTAKIVVGDESPIYITLGVAGEGDDHLAVLFSDHTARSHLRYIDRSGPRPRIGY